MSSVTGGGSSSSTTKSSPWFDFLFDNAYNVDASEAEASIRRKYPLLLHDKEKIVLAFKDRGGKGRDKVCV